MSIDQRQTANILLVEDNEADARLVQEVLKEGRVKINLSHVEDGEQALRFLKKEGHYSDAPTPDIILLDLNMPKKDGREVLSEIRADPNLMTIPVIILTVSESEIDILQSYSLQANAYITKPVHLNQFIETIRSIEGFWLSINRTSSSEERLRLSAHDLEDAKQRIIRIIENLEKTLKIFQEQRESSK